MTKPVNASFRFDPDVKSKFSNILYHEGKDMTQVFESFMINYIRIYEERRK